MDKKNKIQIAVIVVAFGASGLVLYNGFFSAPKAPTLTQSPIITPSTSGVPALAAGTSSSQDSQTILPYGSKLDFTLLNQQSLQPQNFSYPQLDPNSDIGISEENLITASQ